MINADMRNYDYYTYSAELDAYGQQILSPDIQGSVKLAIYDSTQTIQDNINYKDCSYIGLTTENNITDSFVIKYGEEKLKVLYVNPRGKFKQVFLKKI